MSQSRLSRRDVVNAALLSGISAALPRGVLAAASAPSVIKKAIPATGEKIPVMGIGTNQFGRTPYEDVRDIIKRMHELGGAVIDTAAMYGDSEAFIGKALAELGIAKQMFVATKFNMPGIPNDRAGAFGKDSVDRSLERLGKIDLLFIHMLASIDSMMPLAVDLKKQGKVRYIGITTVTPSDHPQLVEYMNKYPMDFVQVDYTLENRVAEKDVFPLAEKKKIAVMAAQPFGGGRNSLMNKVNGRTLPPWAADYDITSWSQYFLKYVISHPAVTCAIPGSSKVVHLEDNQAAGQGKLPDAAARKKMEEYWAKA
jgi:aryl-alcohol dehydrogenase-like predicted oxidoreductase